MNVQAERNLDNVKQLASDFAHLKEKVLITTPVLEETIKKNGNETLYVHALRYKKIQINPIIAGRRQEFITTVTERVKNLLGETIARSVAAQLQQNYLVSTDDHHGPICHPFFLNANLITAATQADSNLENIIVLSCANVSLNNSSFPRGLLFHSDIGDTSELHRLSFFPAKDNPCSVYGLRGYTQKDLNRVKSFLGDKVLCGEVRPEIASKITQIIDRVYNLPSILESKNYSEQITKTNFLLWQEFFAPYKQIPNLVYIDQETITNDLLIHYHLSQDTIINKIILNTEYHDLLIKYFEGIIGAFISKDNIGTFLFWGLPRGKKYRQRLWVSEGELVNNDGTFRVALTASAITEKLRSGELIPSMLLTFIVMSFYYGVTCLGGFCQPSYLTAMKEGYLKMLKEVENNAEIDICQQVETKIMGGDMALAFLRDKQGSLYQATGLDLVLYGTDGTWNKIVELAKIMSFQEATDIMMPLFYEVMYPESKREKKLQHITVDQIARLTGLDKKIKPYVKM
jgi:hypothetical protein